MHCLFGIATLPQLAFPGESDPKFPRKKPEGDNKAVKYHTSDYCSPSVHACCPSPATPCPILQKRSNASDNGNNTDRINKQMEEGLTFFFIDLVYFSIPPVYLLQELKIHK